MEKPITLVIQETRNHIVEVANNSNLPIWVISQIMKEIATQAEQLAKQEHDSQVAAYQKSLNEEAEDGKH